MRQLRVSHQVAAEILPPVNRLRDDSSLSKRRLLFTIPPKGFQGQSVFQPRWGTNTGSKVMVKTEPKRNLAGMEIKRIYAVSDRYGMSQDGVVVGIQLSVIEHHCAWSDSQSSTWAP